MYAVRIFGSVLSIWYTMIMAMTMTFVIVSSGCDIFNAFINYYDQGFILNHKRPYIIS